MANIEDILNLNIDSDEEPDFGSDTTYDSDADLIPYDGANAVTPPLPPRQIVVDASDAANEGSPPPPPPPPPSEDAADAPDAVSDSSSPPRRIVVDTSDAANNSSTPPPPPPPPGAAAAATDDFGAPVEEIASSDFRHDSSHSCPRCDVVNGTPGQCINANIEGWVQKNDPRPLTKAESDVRDVMKAYGYMINPCKK